MSNGQLDSTPGLGRSHGGGIVNALQYSCLGNPMDRGDWLAIVHGIIRVESTEQPSMHAHEHAQAVGYLCLEFSLDVCVYICVYEYK